MMTRILIVLVVATGCNSMLGVANVELQDIDAGTRVDAPQPDANRTNCKLDEHYARLTIDDTNSIVEADATGTSLFTALNDVDSIFIKLRDNQGGHGRLLAFGNYQLTAQDSALSTCGICVIGGADFNSSTSAFDQEYVARQQGQLHVATATATQLSGNLQNLIVRHIVLDSEHKTTTDAPDMCTAAFDQIDFNVTLGASLQPSPTLQALRDRLPRSAR